MSLSKRTRTILISEIVSKLAETNRKCCLGNGSNYSIYKFYITSSENKLPPASIHFSTAWSPQHFIVFPSFFVICGNGRRTRVDNGYYEFKIASHIWAAAADQF